MSKTTTDLLYLVTIVTFILALRFLSSPKRARQGNLLGAAGMALAIAVTLAQDGLENYGWIALAMAIIVSTDTAVIQYQAAGVTRFPSTLDSADG